MTTKNLTFKRVYGEDIFGKKELIGYECVENPSITIKLVRGGGWYSGNERVIAYTIRKDDKHESSWMTLAEAKQMAAYL